MRGGCRGMSGVFATGGAGCVRVWCVETARELLRIEVPNFTCAAVLFAGDGRSIISGERRYLASLRVSVCSKHVVE